MKMRFTDIHKWGKLWFRGLSPEAKLLLLYMYDACGDAGVIEIDPNRYAFDTGLGDYAIQPSINELIDLGKLKVLDERYYILPSFIKFQYPKGLKRNYNPHKSAWREIQKHEIDLEDLQIPTLEQGLTKPFKVRVKVKDKDKYKIRIKNIWLKAVDNAISPRINFDSARMHTINKYLEDYSLLQLVRVWQQAGRSDFLTNRSGNNRNGWQANFDWIHKPANWRKITEGEYDNRGRTIKYGF